MSLSQVDAGQRVVHQNQRDALLVGHAGVGLHIDRNDVVFGARRGGKDLLAVDDPLVALAPRRGAHGTGVGAGVGLGHRDRHAYLARHQLGQKVALLRFRAVVQQVQAVEHRGAVGAQHVVALAAQLFADDGEVHHVAAQAAVFLGEHHRNQPHLDECVIDLVGITCIDVGFPDVFGRGHPVEHLAHAVAQDVLLFGKTEIHLSFLLLEYETGARLK